MVNEVVDVHRAPGGAHGLVDRSNADLQRASLLIVDDHLVLGFVILAVGAYRTQFRVLVGQLQELVARLHQCFMTQPRIVLQKEVEAHGVTHFQNGRGHERHHRGIFDRCEVGVGALGNTEHVLVVLGALLPALEHDQAKAGVLSATGKVEAVDCQYVLDQFAFLALQVVLHLGENRFGALG